MNPQPQGPVPPAHERRFLDEAVFAGGEPLGPGGAESLPDDVLLGAGPAEAAAPPEPPVSASLIEDPPYPVQVILPPVQVLALPTEGGREREDELPAAGPDGDEADFPSYHWPEESPP